MRRSEGTALPKTADVLVAGFFAVLAAFALAFALSIGPNAAFSDYAYATIYPANDAAQTQDASDESPDVASEGAAGSSAAAAVDADQADEEGEAGASESIDEEETPMSSGLGGGEPVSSSGFSFGPVAVVGIAVVLAFFYVLIRRLNGSIRDMNRMFR